MSEILVYCSCSSLSPSTSVASSNVLNQQVSYFLFLKAYANIHFPLELRNCILHRHDIHFHTADNSRDRPYQRTKYSLFQWKLLILDVVEFLRLLFFVNGKLESVRTRWRLFSAPPKNYALHQKLYGDGIAWYNSSPRLKKGCHAWDMAVSVWEINILTFWSSGMLTEKQC